HQFSLSQVREIMVVAFEWLAIMGVKFSIPMQTSDELFFLGIDTENRQTPPPIVFAKLPDVLELGVAQVRVHLAD
ncbi:MAG: hypothetical protein ACJAVK_003317, partial [Akkermansiaceae bacterium]